MTTEQLVSEFVDIKTAATITGMSTAWWRAKIWRREVPFHRLGRRILISRDDISTMLAASRVEPKQHQS